MSTPNSDKIFVLGIALIFGLALCLFIGAVTVTVSQQGHERIGTITYKDHVAERKLSAQVVWSGLEQNGPVFNGDTIHTALGASATIHLTNQADISLGEETLVRLDVSPQRADIFIDGGDVAVHKPNSGTPLRLTTGSDTVNLHNGSLSLLIKGERRTIALADGQANFTRANLSRELQPGTTLDGKTGKVSLDPIRLLEPAAGSALYQAEPNETILFRWLTMPTGNQGPPPVTRLVVASDSAFQRIEFDQPVKGDQARLAVSESSHYWKIVRVGSDGGLLPPSSATSWFCVLRQNRPVPLEPSNRTILASPNQPIAAFSWSGVANAIAYRLIVKDRTTGQVVATREATGTSLVLDQLRSGTFQWQISAFCGPSGQEFSSDLVDFTIKTPTPGPPHILDQTIFESGNGSPPDAIRRITAEALRQGAPIARWSAVPGVDYYETRIVADPQGTKILVEARSDSNAIGSQAPLAPATYYLQVRSVSGSRRSDFCAPMAFAITAAQAIIALAPANDYEADPDRRQVELRWHDPNEAKTLTLQLADDPGFGKPWLEMPAKASPAVVQIPPEHRGRIYWRVTAPALNVSSLSRRIWMPQRLAEPVALAPIDGVALDINAMEKLQLSWRASDGANRYKLSMFQLLGAKKSLIQSWETPSLQVDINQFKHYGIGTYVWTISAHNLDKQVSLARSPEVSTFFALRQSQRLPPPNIHRPAAGVKP